MPLKTCPSCQAKVGPRLRQCKCGYEWGSGSAPRQSAEAQPASVRYSRHMSRVAIPGVGGDRRIVVYPFNLAGTDYDTVRQWMTDCQTFFNDRNQWYTAEAFRYVVRHHYQPPDNVMPRDLADTVNEVYFDTWGFEEDSLQSALMRQRKREELMDLAYGTAPAEQKEISIELDEDDVFADFGIKKPSVLPPQ